MADKDYNIKATINATDHASGVFSSFGSAVTSAMNMAAAAAGAAAVAFAALSFNWTAEFESSMSNVAAVTRASTDELAALNQQALNLGRDSAFSANETAEAMGFLGMAGFSTKEIYETVPDTLNLAAAGSLALGDAADIASNILTGFNLEAGEMGRVTDVLSEAAASSNTNVSQMGEAMKYLAPAAEAAGWSLEESAAAVGLLGNAGIQGSMAGTTLRQAILRLIDPTDDALSSMNALGLSVVDGNGELLGLAEILAQVDPAVLDTAEGLGHLSTIFGARSVSGIAALVGQSSDALVEFTTQLENSGGAAEEMANTKLDNLKGAMTLLKSSIQNVGLSLFGAGKEESLSSSIQGFLTESLIPMANALADWITQLGGLPGVLTTVWEIIVLFSGDVKTAFVNLFTDWTIFSGFVTMMGQALGGALLSVAQFAGEFILAIADVALVLWLPLVSPFSVMISQVQELFTIFLNWIGPMVIDTVNGLLSPVRGLMDIVGVEIGEFDWTPLTVTPALSMEDTWKSSWEAVGEQIATSADEIKTSAGELGDELGVVGQTAADAVALANPEFGNFGDKVQEVIDKNRDLNATIIELPTTMQDEVVPPVVEALEEVDTSVDSTEENFTSMFDWISEKARSTGGTITSAMATGWNNYMTTIPNLQESIGNGMSSIGGTMENEMSNSFTEIIKYGKTDFKDGMSAVGDAAAQAIGDALSAQVMKRLVGPAVDMILSMFTQGFSGVAQAAGGLASSLGGVLSGSTGVGSAISGITSSAGSALSGIAGAAGALGVVGTLGVGAAVAGLAYGISKLTEGKESKGGHARRLANEYAGVSGGPIAWANWQILEADTNDSSDHHRSGAIKLVDQIMSSGIQLGWDPAQFHEAVTASLTANSLKNKGWSGSLVSTYADAVREAVEKSYAGDSGVINFHSGGAIPGEGLFLGLSGEGVLNRRAMSSIGSRGLDAMNSGDVPGTRYEFTIYAMDGTDVERVLTEKIIPSLQSRTEAGEEVIHIRGVKQEIA